MLHIGQKIQVVLKSKRWSVTAFAKKINTDRNNVYHIFKRKSIDTDLLYKISTVLDYDFFADFNPIQNTLTDNNNEVEELSISALKEWIAIQFNDLKKVKK